MNEALEPTPRSELGTRRCASHSFILSPEGECVRCRSEAERSHAHRRIVGIAAGAAVLATCVLVFSGARARAATQQVVEPAVVIATAQPVGAESLDERASGARLPEDGPGIVSGMPYEPIAPPTVTPAVGLGSHTIDDILAQQEAEKEALAKKLIADRLAQTDDALAAMNRRIAQEAAAQQAAAAKQAAAAAAQPRPVYRRRITRSSFSTCGCNN